MKEGKETAPIRVLFWEGGRVGRGGSKGGRVVVDESIEHILGDWLAPPFACI